MLTTKGIDDMSLKVCFPLYRQKWFWHFPWYFVFSCPAPNHLFCLVTLVGVAFVLVLFCSYVVLLHCTWGLKADSLRSWKVDIQTWGISLINGVSCLDIKFSWSEEISFTWLFHVKFTRAFTSVFFCACVTGSYDFWVPRWTFPSVISHQDSYQDLLEFAC